MTPNVLDELIASGLTGMSITVKGEKKSVKKYCKADVNHVWEIIQAAYKKGVHIEIICLIIPTVNDNDLFFTELIMKILSISNQIPIHFTRFFPDYKFTHTGPTPISTLENAHQIAKRAGLEYVYLGNVFGHPLENTYCPRCNQQIIRRTGYEIDCSMDLHEPKCSNCDEIIPIKT
jgi:pyruvate formate lyase activating enzyme